MVFGSTTFFFGRLLRGGIFEGEFSESGELPKSSSSSSSIGALRLARTFGGGIRESGFSRQ